MDETRSDEERLDRFVADLTELRRQAGQPSLRKMSQRSHYSHTAVSGALSGNRLPSQELTLGFVRACGGDEDAWRERWERDHAQLSPGDELPHPSRSRSRWRGRWLVWAVAGLVSAVMAAALLWVSVIRPAPPAAGPSTGAAVESAAAAASTGPATDGTDPQEQKCDVDAMHITTVDVHDVEPGKPSFGSLTLRYSPRCRAAWPLFVSTEQVPRGAVVHLETRRPSDGAVTEFDYPFLVDPTVWSVFGNNLRTTEGCVTVAVEIRAPQDQRPLAAAETACTTVDA